MNRSLLRNRDFRLVSGSVGLSALGDWVAMIALGLQVKEISDSGFAVAALWICLFGPSVLVAGHAGLLVDRFEATRLLAAVSAAGAVVALALGFLHGRAFAAYNGIRNSAELGAFAAGGLLVAAIGARGTLAFAGGLSALAGAVGLAIMLRRNRGWASAEPGSATAAEEVPHPAHETTVATADEVGRID